MNRTQTASSAAQPITTAVYGNKRSGKKPAKPQPPRRAERLVGRMIGDEQVAEVYRGLGFKRPEERRRRGR